LAENNSRKPHDCPGPGIRLLAFLVLYVALIWISRDEWPRFIFLFLLAVILVPPGLRAWKRGARMLLAALPAMAALGVMIWIFGTLGGAARAGVFADLMIRTVVAISSAALIWGGAGMREFLTGLVQLRAPGVVVSVMTLALQSTLRMRRQAGTTLAALRSRSGFKIPLGRRIALAAPLFRHFLTGLVEFHFHFHAALVSRGYSGGPLPVTAASFQRREWMFLPIFSAAALVVAVI